VATCSKSGVPRCGNCTDHNVRSVLKIMPNGWSIVWCLNNTDVTNMPGLIATMTIVLTYNKAITILTASMRSFQLSTSFHQVMLLSANSCRNQEHRPQPSIDLIHHKSSVKKESKPAATTTTYEISWKNAFQCSAHQHLRACKYACMCKVGFF